MKIFTNKTPSIFIFYLILIISFQAKAQTIPTLEDRVDSLLSKMTLDEKILQLHKEGNFNTAANTKKKVKIIKEDKDMISLK